MCACCCPARETDIQGREDLGPALQRRHTDVPCCVGFVLYASVLGALFHYVARASNVASGKQMIDHGRDHELNFCGLGPMSHKPYAFFPDLNRDIARDPHLRTLYGVCVQSCPPVGGRVADYGGSMRQPEWLVTAPSFPLLSRCIPYDPPGQVNGTLLCADPGCTAVPGVPTSPREVCGLRRDGSGQFWLMSAPDVTMVEGWVGEGADGATVQARIALALSAAGSPEAKSCRAPMRREVKVSVKAAGSSDISVAVFTRFSGLAFELGSAIFSNKELVLGIGLGGALALCVVITLLFPYCVRAIVLLLLALLFLALVAANYTLYVQAGIARGVTGTRIKDYFEKRLDLRVPATVDHLLHRASSDDTAIRVYVTLALLLSMFIAFAACLACALRRKFTFLVSLLHESGRVVRSIPGILVFPVVPLLGMALACIPFVVILFCLLTAEKDQWGDILTAVAHDQSDKTFQNARTVATCAVVLGFLWLYFFLVAVYTTVVAHAVAQWYFRSRGQSQNSVAGCTCLPLVVSSFAVCWYHLGSLAYGSLLMTLFTLPRLLVEYIIHQFAGDDAESSVVRTISCCARCVTAVLQGCMQMITEYSYVYIAVTGRPFWASAHGSFELFSQYPVQVALNRMVCVLLGYVLCVTVPVSLATVTFLLTDQYSRMYCAAAVLAISYVITRFAAGVYDVCVTTLLVCVMRDEKFHGGAYTTPELRQAARLPLAGQGVELDPSAR